MGPVGLHACGPQGGIPKLAALCLGWQQEPLQLPEWLAERSWSPCSPPAPTLDVTGSWDSAERIFLLSLQKECSCRSCSAVLCSKPQALVQRVTWQGLLGSTECTRCATPSTLMCSPPSTLPQRPYPAKRKITLQIALKASQRSNKAKFKARPALDSHPCV